MTAPNPLITFGEPIIYGEIARGSDPSDEIGLQMAMILSRPDPEPPPFAAMPVFLRGLEIGTITQIRYVHGVVIFNFRSQCSSVRFSTSSMEALLAHLLEVLKSEGQQGGP